MLLETVELEARQTKAFLHQTSSNHKDAEKDLSRMKELLLSDMLERKANDAPAAETKELQVKTDSENLELLKSQKALSRVPSNLETLKKRVVSLEDEKGKFLSTLHKLKAETDDKNHESYCLRRELAKVKNELDSLENVHAKLTRAQDDLDDKNDKMIGVISQNLGI